MILIVLVHVSHLVIKDNETADKVENEAKDIIKMAKTRLIWVTTHLLGGLETLNCKKSLKSVLASYITSNASLRKQLLKTTQKIRGKTD